MVVAGAPVRHHIAFEAPLLAQDIREQMGIFIGIHAVDQIVAGHDGLGIALFHRDLKAGQIDLPQSPLIQHRVRGHPAQLLRVDSKVLGAGAHAAPLDALYVGGRHFTGKVGILGKILKIPSAQGAALDIQTGTKDHMDIVSRCLLSQSPSQLLSQLRIPGVGHSCGGREAGGGQGFVDAQMILIARLFAQAVRAVSHEHGGNTQAGQVVGAPTGLALQKHGLFFQRHFLDASIDCQKNRSLSSVFPLHNTRNSQLLQPQKKSRHKPALFYTT